MFDSTAKNIKILCLHTAHIYDYDSPLLLVIDNTYFCYQKVKFELHYILLSENTSRYVSKRGHSFSMLSLYLCFCL